MRQSEDGGRIKHTKKIFAGVPARLNQYWVCARGHGGQGGGASEDEGREAAPGRPQCKALCRRD